MSISLAVYEDQTGKMLYPEKRSGEDNGIRKLFAGHTLLSIAKEKNRLQFLCRVFAKDSERINGYYVACEGEYVPKIFDDFKEKSKEVLKKLGLELSYVRTPDEIFDSNLIFDNIEKFGSANDEYMKHVDDAINILKSELPDADKRLEYKAGKIDKIAKFCKEMLKLDKIEIIVSSRKMMYGDINIIVENYNGNFSPTERTVQFLDKYNQLMEKKRKEEDDRMRAREAESNAKKIEDGKDKIRKNFLIMTSGDESRLIRSEIQSLEDLGHNSVVFVEEEINKFRDKIATEKMRSGKGIDNNKGRGKSKDDKRDILLPVLMVTVGLMLGIVIGTLFISPYFPDKKYVGSEENQTPVPTAISIQTPAPIATTSIQTPAPIATSGQYVNGDITGNGNSDTTSDTTSNTTPAVTAIQTTVPTANMTTSPTKK